MDKAAVFASISGTNFAAGVVPCLLSYDGLFSRLKDLDRDSANIKCQI